MNILLDSFIDNPLWDRAKWLGVAYLCFSNRPPALGLYFRDRDAGTEIFYQWKTRLGDADALNQMRISIVEGPIVGAAPGYNIRIGSNAETIFKIAEERGVTLDNGHLLYGSRIHRMNPPPGSNNLLQFKTHYATHGVYDLVQVDVAQTGEINVNPVTAIRMTQIHLRQVEHIGDGDLDSDAVVAPLA